MLKFFFFFKDWNFIYLAFKTRNWLLVCIYYYLFTFTFALFPIFGVYHDCVYTNPSLSLSLSIYAFSILFFQRKGHIHFVLTLN